MIISSRRRLYSNIITEDNGDIGVNSTVELWGYEYYWFDDIVKAFLSDNSIEISLDDQNYNNAEYDTYNYARENNTIDVTIATLSDKIAKRFNYDVSKLNTFISGYLDNGFDGDMYGIGTVKLVDVFFYKSSPYSDTIFLKGTFNFNPDFFRTLYFDVPRISGNRSYRRAGIDFNVSVDDYILKYGDDYIPCIYASGGDITINFSNLNIHEDDFIIMTYAETKFAYEEGELNGTYSCRTDYDPDFDTTRFWPTTFDLPKPNIGTDNYVYIITSCTISSTISVAVMYGKTWFEIAPIVSDAPGDYEFADVSSIKYKLIYKK